ncbi:hypothetical protein AMECASPLE_004749 [Ameca splendens]|uniref:Uncharacterized protein n=1 Tax=Ameca splendens TaxID=208324 RepID=A0ABV0ZJ10_9TELE
MKGVLVLPGHQHCFVVSRCVIVHHPDQFLTKTDQSVTLLTIQGHFQFHSAHYFDGLFGNMNWKCPHHALLRFYRSRQHRDLAFFCRKTIVLVNTQEKNSNPPHLTCF